MSWTNEGAIIAGVLNMLRVNMGLKPGESLLIVSDMPRVGNWQSDPLAMLTARLELTVLARMVADIAARHYQDSPVAFWPFPATGRDGAEPDDATAERMRQADVIVALTTYSLSHTNARQSASQRGARVASMPTFEAAMFEAGGPMAVDYRQVADDCRRFADLLTAAEEVVIHSAYGTQLRFSLKGRPGGSDDGLLDSAGRFGNLPAGEAYAVPVEGTAEGMLVTPAGWYPNMAEDLILRIEHGQVVEARGGGTVGDRFRQLWDSASNDPAIVARRNIAELGIGTNPNARKPDNVLEAEKIKGTLHIGIGDNVHMGGQVEADFHDDFVQPQVDLLLDGVPAIVGGAWTLS
jgi:leucyl aminopeptidase (aminopeptidase T)